jgi:hypothetical protein
LKNVLALSIVLSVVGCGAPETTVSDDSQLKSHQFCGGIGGFDCPAGYDCVDDKHDNCDPKKGGVDCGGICVRRGKAPAGTCDYSAPGLHYVGTSADQCLTIKFTCNPGQEYFSDACGCGCQDCPIIDCPAPPAGCQYESPATNGSCPTSCGTLVCTTPA